MQKYIFRVLITGLLALQAACSAGIGAPGAGGTATLVRTPDPSPAATQTQPVITPSQTPGGPLTLRVWLPPQFDPALDTPAGNLLRERLLEFTRQRSRVTLDIRIKAPAGPGGMLDSLTTANAAAPTALPDLAALPRDVLETAALKGLLYPYDGAALNVVEKDWFPYANELAHVQGSLYGLPFAGDALALVYRSETIAEPPADWDALLAAQYPFIFPAADPQALFTLTQYQSQGGSVRDSQGRPMIETLALTEVLTYYAQAKTAGVISDTLTLLQDDEQAWAAFVEQRTPFVVTWCSRYLNNPSAVSDANLWLAPLPTSTRKPFTLATGWVWSLGTKDSERQRVAVELARFLTERSFLAEWTEAAGYLPPYPGALEQWEDAGRQPQVLDRIARSAHSLPSADILNALSGPLAQAVNDVLRSQNDPAAAAKAAAAGLTAP